MKIQLRDIGMLGFGLILGIFLTSSLSLPTSLPQTPKVVGNGPVLAASSVPIPIKNITNLIIQWDSPSTFRMVPTFGEPELPYPPRYLPVDLIDTHYKPDINLNDLK